MNYRRFVDRYIQYFYVVPIVLAMLLVVLYPLIFNIRVSLSQAGMMNFRNPPFIGLGNYWDLFQDSVFWNSVQFTVLYLLGTLSLELVIGIGIALLLYLSEIRFKWLFVTLLIMPLMVSPIFYGVAFKLGFNSVYGVVPYYLGIDPLKSPLNAFLSLMTVDIIRWFPFVFIIVYAGLQAFPEELLEAAEVDAAPIHSQIISVILPVLKPIILVAAVFRAIDAIKIFGLIFMLTGGGPGISTRSVSIQIYYYNFGQFNFGIASAFTILVLLVVTPLIALIIQYFGLLE